MNLWALLGRLTDHLTGGRRKDPSVEELMPEHEVTADVLILRQMSDNPSVSLARLVYTTNPRHSNDLVFITRLTHRLYHVMHAAQGRAWMLGSKLC